MAKRCTVETLESRTLLAGNGLAATYFNGSTLAGAAVARTDAAVNFDWKGASPAAGIAGDVFSARWTGQVEAKVSQAYTFSTVSDDGVRLWVNGQLLVDQWNRHAAREDRGIISLAAGQRYDLKLEYFQQYGGSTMKLYWGGASLAKEVVPQAQLYSTGGTTPVPPPVAQGSLKVSANGRYLVKADGSPFFYLADTAWQIPVKLDRAGVDQYLKDRAAKGFNVIQVVALDGTYARKNRYGQAPLLNNNPATPNSAYFDHLDYIVSKAASYGIYVAMVATWGKNVADPTSRIFNTSNAYTYGHYLGARYRNASNVIWINGGDWAVSDATTANIWRALAQGLTDGDGGVHLMTFHPRGGAASRTYWANESWLDFDMIQSGHTRDSASYSMIGTEYARSPVMPVIEGEANYEDLPVNAASGSTSGPLLNAYDVRKKAYWDVFAGAAGTAYGADEVYQFSTGGGPSGLTWQAALNLPGAGQMKYLRSLMESRTYLTRVPDQSVVTSSVYSGTDRIQATRDAGGRFAMVYSASGRAFTVNMSKVTGTSGVNAAWFDPRTGKVIAIGRFADMGTRTFTPPTSGSGQDWVLTLDRV